MSIELAQVYTDFSGLEALKTQARDDRRAAVDEVSRQFESLFVQMMLKSMRQAGFGGGMLDNSNSEFYRDMYDQQLAVEMSRQRGIGLADVISRQLGGEGASPAAGWDLEDYAAKPVRRIAPGEGTPMRADATPRMEATVAEPQGPGPDGTPEGFIEALWPAAEKAAEQLGLPPQALLAQAALETGWGKHVMSRPDGSSSHNLFGIKADGRWDGERVRVSTLEYQDGVALRTRADFRSYDSWEDSFQDYVRFVQDNPRYREAIRSTEDVPRYFEQLQKAGYATDPAYASKIKRILGGEHFAATSPRGTEA